MSRWWIGLLILAIVGVLVTRSGWFGPSRAGPSPVPVPTGDQEIAWLHIPTAFESWENFVWGVKRAQMSDEGLEGVEVDDAGAFPDRTTAVPEIVLRRKGFAGSLRIRWYKVGDDATQEAWVNALAGRSPAPIAILGGWSSDRARELADAMKAATWRGPRPLLFFTQATADEVYSTDADAGGGPSLVGIYDRSFRFCFTNKQMADAVADFVLSDPTLRPGSIVPPELNALVSSAAGPWAGLLGVAAQFTLSTAPIPAFAIEWKDDPYSTDLSDKFHTVLQRNPPGANLPRLNVGRSQIPFSVGRLNRANRAEAEAAEFILANLPPPGLRTVLVVPTVSAPARRTLRALVQGDPAIGQQLVAITGDGIGVNTFYRDREFAWPVRSLPIPVVLFTHGDPFAWDIPGQGRTAPPGYELPEPKPGAVRSTIEDIQLFSRIAQIVAAAVFPRGANAIVDSPDALAQNLRNLSPPFFDSAGNRLSGNGEHIVVLRPLLANELHPGRTQVDAVLEVYVRKSESRHWSRVRARPLGRPFGEQSE